MMQLLVLILVVGLASADIGLTYKVPDTSYGVPSYQYNNNAEYNTGYAGASGYNYKAESSAQAGYQQNLGQQAGYQYPTPLAADSHNAGYQTANYQNNIGSQYSQTGGLNSGYNTVSQPSYQYSDSSSQGVQGGYQYQSSSEYQSSAVQKYQQFYNNWQQAPAQVFKHFYVHAAPEETEEPKIQPVSLPLPQKHYKIIFIKAPSQTVYQPQYIPVPQPNEEKTIVYVLVKKPEKQQEVVVPKLEQKAPSKPEVFFIKYNNKADSSAVINNIVSDYNKVDSVNFASPGSENQFGSGQYNQGSSGHYNKGSTSYNQFAQKGSAGQASTGFGNSFGGLSTQSVSAAGANAATASSVGYTATSSAGYTAGSAGTSATSPNAISTSQGVPHETYGPPKFRV